MYVSLHFTKFLTNKKTEVRILMVEYKFDVTLKWCTVLQCQRALFWKGMFDYYISNYQRNHFFVLWLTDAKFHQFRPFPTKVCRGQGEGYSINNYKRFWRQNVLDNSLFVFVRLNFNKNLVSIIYFDLYFDLYLIH